MDGVENLVDVTEELVALEEEMAAAVADENFERAAEVKKRIAHMRQSLRVGSYEENLASLEAEMREAVAEQDLCVLGGGARTTWVVAVNGPARVSQHKPPPTPSR